MSRSQAEKNATRVRQEVTGQPYQAALKDLREERLAHREDVLNQPPWASASDGPVPSELSALVRFHADTICRYLNDAVHRARYTGLPFYEWQRMTLYHLTDALEHLNLLIGTVTAYLQEQRVAPGQIRSHLQVRDDKAVQAFVTPSALAHLAGLTGKTATENQSGVWQNVGASIADGTGWSCPEREDALEAALAALYGNYPDDEEAFDNLPVPSGSEPRPSTNCSDPSPTQRARHLPEWAGSPAAPFHVLGP
ncbi:hypothetical protein AB0L75_22705 [Streptomyces sp. NPDC052101]|uniref:hypothetical protein n=1 Tax=Streptomyces sp. NPDC052101 TaxID=3155763 RepID=UPI0034453A13